MNHQPDPGGGRRGGHPPPAAGDPDRGRLRGRGRGRCRARRAARARAQQPDLVLLDIWMPDTDGITLLREWSTSAGEHCPVVMLSGHGTVETAVEATRLGAVDFIEKPLSLAKLLSTVERALETPRRQTARLSTDHRRRAARPQPPDAAAARRPHAPRRLPGAAAAARRDGQRDRGARALRASPQPALLRGVRRRARQGAGRCARVADAVRQRRAAGPARAGRAAARCISAISRTCPMRRSACSPACIDSGGFQRSGCRARAASMRACVATAHAGRRGALRRRRLGHDLYALLAVLPVRVPPLRDYAEDVPELLRTTSTSSPKPSSCAFRRFSVAAQNRLRNYPWPDNLRELRDLVRRAAAARRRRGDLAARKSSASWARRRPATAAGEAGPAGAAAARGARALRARLPHAAAAAVRRQGGQLAKRVGMERTHLYRKLRSLGIEIGQSERGLAAGSVADADHQRVDVRRLQLLRAADSAAPDP